MTAYLRITAAIAAAFMLVSCTPTTAGVKPNPTASDASVSNPACLNETGTRIPGRTGNCAAFGRSYSNDDINRTGSTSAGGALQLLDPSITVHR